MAKQLKCNSCGGIYPDTRDGSAPTYFHACPDEILVTPDVTDDKGKVTKPATFKPMPNPRNENLKPDPENPGKYVMISEGSGVTEVE
jgi:hypothetical protein